MSKLAKAATVVSAPKAETRVGPNAGMKMVEIKC
jgi:hypothetical protein